MNMMFRDASAFNGDISNWDVSFVTNTREMFKWATSFNRDISEWDVSSVTEMRTMFYYAIKFDQDISSWNVSSVTKMGVIFEDAEKFNQDLYAWGELLPKNAWTSGAFSSNYRPTSCPTTSSPNLNAIPPGPFCHVCS